MHCSILFVSLCVGVVYAATTTCPENEQYATCATACPRTCQSSDSEVRPCPAICLRGCVCKEGFIREGPNGKCVPEEACQDAPKCKENEEFTPCIRLCPPTCQKSSHPLLCSARRCVSGCACKTGYIRERLGGECIQENKCPI